MTKFEILMAKSDVYTNLALRERYGYMKVFYLNVASGYRERAVSLSIEEGEQLI